MRHVAQVKIFLAAANLTEAEMLAIEKPVALTIVNNQRAIVPVGETGATKASISQHIQESSATKVVDEIGPETDYSGYIEFGVLSKPNYPIQPFVRPSAFGRALAEAKKVAEVAMKGIAKKKYG